MLESQLNMLGDVPGNSVDTDDDVVLIDRNVRDIQSQAMTVVMGDFCREVDSFAA